MLESNNQPATPHVKACPVEHTFDPFDPAYLADPYPQFAIARRAEPIFYEPQLDMYVVTRYSEIESVCWLHGTSVQKKAP